MLQMCYKPVQNMNRRCAKQNRRCASCRFGDSCPNSAPNCSPASDIATEIASLKQRCRLLPLIPKGARIAVADALARCINDVVTQGTDTAWRKLMRFGYVTLTIRNNEKKKRVSLATQVRNNLSQDENFNPPIPARKRRAQNKQNRQPNTTKLLRRVSGKLTDGDLRGALRLLASDDSFATPTVDVITRMQEKHPEPPTDFRAISPPEQDTAVVTATEADVLKAINSFPPSSSAGLDGIDLLTCDL